MKKSKLVCEIVPFLCIGTLLIFLHSSAVAQPTVSEPSRSALSNAVALFNGKKPDAANSLLSGIPPDDADYAQAQCYRAACLYDVTNYSEFLKQIESAAVNEAAIDADLRHKLDFEHIDVLFKYRRFEQIFTEIDSFQRKYGNSSTRVVSEYKMAALFERGMKKAIEAANLPDQDNSAKRWSEARSNLAEFVSLRASFPSTNYALIPNRNLNENLWSARIAIGDDQAAYSEIPAQDHAAQEKFCFLRIQLLAEKFYRQRVDQNIPLMTNYLAKFPPSDNAKRVEFDLAAATFRKGEQLIYAAEAAEQAQDLKTAQSKRALASAYFQQMRPLQSRIVTNAAAGINDSDVTDSREDLLYSYSLEKNYEKLLSLATLMFSSAQRGDLDWLDGKLYAGIALMKLPIPKMKESAQVLDEVLAQGFQDKPDHDHFIIYAAKWRIFLYRESREPQKVVELIRGVHDSNCNKKLKADFLKTYGSIAGFPQN